MSLSILIALQFKIIPVNKDILIFAHKIHIFLLTKQYSNVQIIILQDMINFYSIEEIN